VVAHIQDLLRKAMATMIDHQMEEGMVEVDKMRLLRRATTTTGHLQVEDMEEVGITRLPHRIIAMTCHLQVGAMVDKSSPSMDTMLLHHLNIRIIKVTGTSLINSKVTAHINNNRPHPRTTISSKEVINSMTITSQEADISSTTAISNKVAINSKVIISSKGTINQISPETAMGSRTIGHDTEF
jgi:hypothetical protein